MRLKIIHLISHLKVGGAESLVTNYALNINKEKFEMVIITTSQSHQTVNEKILQNEGVKVIYLGDMLKYSNPKNVFQKIINKIQRHLLFHKVINKEKPNVIHSHLGANAYLLPLNTKKLRINLFYTIHSELNISFGKGRCLNKIITKYCVKWKGMIPIALHSKMRNEANILFNTDRTLVIPNGVDVERFLNVKTNKNTLLKSLNIQAESFVIGHVGRFVEAKNHKFLIDVFAEVKKKKKNAHLVLIGTGDLEKEVQNYANNLDLINSISFLGDRSDVPELMSIMDVFVFPSLYEGFGNVLIEAQAAGKPCIISDTVPSEANITKLVIPLSLETSLEEWSDTIINSKKENINNENVKRYDITNIIKTLENTYYNSVMN